MSSSLLKEEDNDNQCGTSNTESPKAFYGSVKFSNKDEYILHVVISENQTRKIVLLCSNKTS